MSEIDTVAVMKAKPGSETTVSDALTKLVPPTLAEEGCLDYRLYESTSEPGTFVTIERWRSQEDLDAHMQSDHIAEALAAAGDHMAAPPGIHPLTPITG